MTQKEFDIVKKEIKRKRGEDNSVTTEEEKSVCERVSGLPYEKLWDHKNEWIAKK